MFRIPGALTTLSLAAMLAVTAPAVAADVEVTTDTLTSFRATFTGLDTDATTIDGNDFQQWAFNYWTVVVNLRVDGIDGEAYGFYEINVRRTGTVLADPDAPVVKTFLFYGNLQDGLTLTDSSVSSAPHGDGTDYLSTTVNIVFDGQAKSGAFSGAIAGEADLDGDTEIDTKNTDVIVDTLKGLKGVGVITGQEMGQIIKQTKQPRK